MAKTGIEWTERTWNPLRGCSRISDGCRNCYAERMAARFSGPGEPFANVIQDGKWSRRVELVKAKLEEPLRWRKPCRVFVNSMSDLFHESVQFDWIERIWGVMAACPQHTFQILTKRPLSMYHCVSQISNSRRPLQNVWLGVSVEDQDAASVRLPCLLKTPAAVRFVSVEPLLGPVDLYYWLPTLEIERESGISRLLLNWVIVGGESGPGARPCRLEWIRSIVSQCAVANVPCFVKQLGTTWVRDGWQMGHAIGEAWVHSKGNDPAHWPADLNVRQYPEVVDGLDY